MLIAADHLDTNSLNARFQTERPDEIVRWAAREFADGLVMTSSFGADSAVLLHMVSIIVPGIRVVFIDTGFLFPETHQFVEQLRLSLGLNVWHYRTRNDPFTYLQQSCEPDPHWRRDVGRCCAENKNEPMDRAMRELRPAAWLRGIRRGQSAAREQRQYVEWSRRYSCYAVSPLLDWTDEDTGSYLEQHGLPRHPLVERGFRSIGCSPASCTRAVTEGEDTRAGRWAGTGKLECGLHLEDYQI